MRRFSIGPGLLLCILCFRSLYASFSGSVRPTLSIMDYAASDSASRYIVKSPVRLMLRLGSGSFRGELALAVTPSMGNPSLSGEDFSGGAYRFRINDIERRLVPADWSEDTRLSVLQNLDRASVRIRLPALTVTAGRQAVFWGVAKSISPTDFIAPFGYSETDTEYRSGVDALRINIPAGMLSEVDLGYLFGEDAALSRSGFWARGRFYVLRTDLSVLAGGFRQNLLLGGSINRTLGRGTGWLEAAFTRTGALSDSSSAGESFWSVSAGWDRSWFSSLLYAYLEYHFSSAGANGVPGYSSVLQSPALNGGGIYLLGKQYICPGISWNPHPLVTAKTGALISLTDGSAFISVSGEYSAGDNSLLEAGIYRGLGEGPDENGLPGSEFGSWPGEVFLRYGYYF